MTPGWQLVRPQASPPLRTASIRLEGSATHCQAMSKAVPCATLVRTMGKPSVTFTARRKPAVLSADVPLVVVHGHHGVEITPEGIQVKCVVGERSVGVEALRLRHLDRGADDADLLVAEEAVLARVRVERRDGHARRTAAGQWPHRPVGQANLGGDRVDREEIENLPKRYVQRDVHHAQPGPGSSRFHVARISRQVEHHGVVARAASFRENLGVAGMRNAGQRNASLFRGSVVIASISPASARSIAAVRNS